MSGVSRRSATEQSVSLPYTIAQCSAHSGKYAAENILVDDPANQSSRWSGAYQGNANQWIVLRLENMAVLKSITFGKFHKPHPCNMKEFKIYVGVTDDHMSEVLHSGLKNDPIPETFPLKHVNKAGVSFPTRYIKIVPLSAHGQSFHTSIWHVSMTGIIDENMVERVRVTYDEYRETAVLKHLLKHLRQRRLLGPYESILSRAGIQMEHPLVTKLHESIVLQGDWYQAEQLIPTIYEAGLFDSYLQAAQPHASWKRLYGTDADGDMPSPRGGHSMCIDPINDMIYLFGGWDGTRSLDDFWVYSVKEEKWRVLSHSTSSAQNAPGARSCHKMVFDTKTGSIYILGRLNDQDTIDPRTKREPTTLPPLPPGATNTPPITAQPSPEEKSPKGKTICSEFYRYHTRGVDAGKWDFLSFDTASSGGPPLVFDHQMVMDSDSQIMYVFGGRVVDGDWNSVKYSGLYSYNVRLNKWKLLQHPDTSNTAQVIIPSRFGHSMVLEPYSRTLYIFAGQRDDTYLSDMYAYDIATNTATEIYTNFTTAGGPDACFTQRAVIDPHLREIYVVCGLTRSPQSGSVTTLPSESPNWVFRYEPRPGKWMQVLPVDPEAVERDDLDDDFLNEVEEPLPRYAHQVVYNPITKTVFMHGGNAGIVGQMERNRRNSIRNSRRDSIMSRRDSVMSHRDSLMSRRNSIASRRDSMMSESPTSERRPERREQRLDDFWQMNLIRSGSEKIIRRATYSLRQQQFREMCEEMSAVKALNFLQTEVSNVVDHSDPEEAESFRALLTHLLSPAPPSPPIAEPVPPKTGPSPPRKWSRPTTPGGDWTDKLEDDNTDYAHLTGSVSVHALRDTEDPLERELRAGDPRKLNEARFTQRNAVFESLLRFISEKDKQPCGSLLDMVDGDEGGL
ncbi:Muskelin N-terminus-domain-containing protein [Collybia nuda]|uniref:Muskelin N-terminus-domain-containing protein n=1 Tax=Collybia nuda TaxID=64659 RepID=A0A9P5YGF7_9AGAR|nr:Muskelin N-terminus-domain-containing protein [Collybia nuda]